MTEPLFEAPAEETPVEETAAGEDTPAEEMPGMTHNRRGRPRSQETLARDERVKEALAASAMTRETLAEKLGEKASLVYLALWRLNRAGVVEKTSDGARHQWQLVDPA